MTTDADAIEIPSRPNQGDIWFSINLELLDSDEIEPLHGMLSQLGFDPRPAFKSTASGRERHVLLAHRTFADLPQLPSGLYRYEQQVLSDFINPDAIEFTGSLTKPA